MPERFFGDWPKDAFIPFSQGNILSIEELSLWLMNSLQVSAVVLGDGARNCTSTRE